MTEFYWHLHHEVLCEPLTEPIENRIAYIKAEKPRREIATRLRLMRPADLSSLSAFVKARAALVKAGAAYDKAGAAYDKAGAAYDKAGAAYGKAWAAYVKARAAYDKAWAAYGKAWAAYGKARAEAQLDLERLHKQQCLPDCPWDGMTIFPRSRK